MTHCFNFFNYFSGLFLELTPIIIIFFSIFRWGNGKSGTQNIDWTKLNPQKLVSEMRPMFAEYPGVPGLDSFDEFMKMVSKILAPSKQE